MSPGQTGHITGQMGRVPGTDGTHTRGCPAKILYVYWVFSFPRKSGLEIGQFLRRNCWMISGGPFPATDTPQIWGVKISLPKFRERAPENTIKQVFFVGDSPVNLHPPNLGGMGFQGSSPGPFGLQERSGATWLGVPHGVLFECFLALLGLKKRQKAVKKALRGALRARCPKTLKKHSVRAPERSCKWRPGSQHK